MQALKALQPQDAAKAAAILEHLTQAVQEMEKIWGASPYLHLGEIGFRRRKNKAAMPLLDVYFVLGEMYSHDKYYQATPSVDHPGLYEFKHKQIQYRLSSSTYRKTVYKHLVPLLRTLAETQNHQSKMALKTDPKSGTLEMKFRAPDCSPLAFRFIPALRGTSLPDGVNPRLSTLEEQPIWFLIAPQDSKANGTWELNFPNVGEDLLGSANTSSILLASWLSEMHSLELENPTRVLTSLAIELQQAGRVTLQPDTPIRAQTVNVMQKLVTKAKGKKSLIDFCVPTREHLPQNIENLESFIGDLEKAISDVKSAEEWAILAGSYPGTLPEDSVTGDVVDLGDIPDDESSAISSTTTDSEGVVTGGETESETPPTNELRSPIPATRMTHRRSVTRTNKVSTSESENEETVKCKVNGALLSEGPKGSRFANGVRLKPTARSSSEPILKVRDSVMKPRRVNFKVVTTLLIVFLVAAAAAVIHICLGEYDLIHEITRFYDAIFNKNETANHGVDIKSIVSANQNDI